MKEIHQIDETTWRIEDEYVRFFLLVGNEKAAMIDSGAFNDDAKQLCETLTDLPIILVNTHGDGDHISGTGKFAEIHVHEKDYVNCGIDKRFPDTKLVPIKEGDTIDLGGRTLEIIEIPGHTKGSVAILDVEKRTLFAGDSVQKGFIFMFGEHRIPDKYEESLKKIITIADRYDTIIASHAEPIIPADYTQKVLDAWYEVINGNVTSEEAELHGMKVKAYKTPDCGFYL